MSTFKDILQFTLQWEGGYVNDPDDPGGTTNMGITQRTYDAYSDSVTRARRSVQKITKAEVYDIYLRQYWQPTRCDQLSPEIAAVVFDTAVNRGVVNASKMLQKLVGAKEDGVIGINTIHAAMKAPEDLCDRYIDAREAHHKWRALTRPTQWKFLKGWLNRTAALRQYARSLSL